MKSVAALFLLLIAAVLAHDTWIEKDGDVYTLRYGHLDYKGSHEGVREIPYDPKKVVEAVCAKGEITEKVEFERNYPVRVEKRCDELYFLMDNGYFTKTPYGTKPVTKDKARMAVYSWHSIESVKYVNRPVKRAIGRSLELVFVSDIPNTKEKARLELMFDGKPARGVVSYFGKPRGYSGSDGRINIKIKREGFQKIEASLKEPCKDLAKCDETVYTTSLIFGD